MPIYEYHCHSCDAHFEINQSMSAPMPDGKPGCSSAHCRIEKKISRCFSHTVSRAPGGSASGPKAESTPQAKTTSQPGHSCSKYCGSHHGT